MAFAFEKLLVYQKAVDFADAVGALAEDWARAWRSGIGLPAARRIMTCREPAASATGSVRQGRGL